jgi:hypothetical protein
MLVAAVVTPDVRFYASNAAIVVFHALRNCPFCRVELGRTIAGPVPESDSVHGGFDSGKEDQSPDCCDRELG